MGSGGLEQTNALFRKNIVIQRRARKTNCCLVFFPLVICGLVGGLQIAIDRQIAKEKREHPIVVDCSCNNAVVSDNTTGGAVCSEECPLPRAPKWPPVLHIPFSYDGKSSCSAGAGVDPESCAARFLVTGTNQSFVSGVMDNMIPVQSASANVSANDISALADFVLATRYYMGNRMFGPPGVSTFLQNTCTPDVTLSYAYIYGDETSTRDVNCTEGLMLWRDTPWLISDELYRGYYQGNSTNEISAAYDFLSSDQSNFNLVISYNSTNRFDLDDTGITIIQVPGQAPSLLQIPRLTNMASNAYLHLRGSGLKISLDFVKEMPRAAKSFDSFDISSIIGRLPYLWTMMLFFPVILTNLVYEKQNKLRIMMKMHGLGDLPYWTITYCYFILLSTLYVLSFMLFGVAFRLSFFRLNNYGLQFVFYFAYMNLQFSFAFLMATCFSNVRTAAVTGYFYIFGSGLIGEFFFKPYIEDIFLSGSWITLLELFPPFSLYRIVYEFSQSALLVSDMGSTGMQWSDLSDTKNGMRSVLTIMILEWMLFMLLSFYLDHFGSFQNGIRKAVSLLRSHRAAKRSSAAQQQTVQIQEFKASVEMEKADVIKEREIVGQLLQEPNSSYSVICDNLKKVYRGKDGNSKKIAVRELSLSMARGQCFGVLGPNGAGKTTLINMLTGFTKPTSGTAYIEGMDIRLDMDKIYTGIGVCPQHDLLWETLTGREHLLFYGRLKKLKGAQLSQAIKQSLKSVRLFDGGVPDKLVAKYSGGMKRRLSVAISLIGDPKVVYMDEPSSGLDPASRKDLWNAVKSAKQDRAIILTTHSMEEAEVLCDRIGIIADGTLQCIGNSKELKTKYGGSYVLTITTAAGEDAEEVEKLVQSISPGVSKVYHISGTQKFEMPKEEVRISDVFHAMENAKSRVAILAETPRYRDRAKERREDQNPDYEPTELGSFHAVAPPGADLRLADAQKISIEKSKYLGGDLEHTHLVKGLDFALLNKVRSEIDKKPDAEDGKDAKARETKEDRSVSFRTAIAKSVYQWTVKQQQSMIKANDMFLPGRMAFIYNMEDGLNNDIPTTLHRSKADCPVPEEMVTVSVDGSVLDRIAKIMSYLRLGSSGKVLKKKKKERDTKGKSNLAGGDYDEAVRRQTNGSALKQHSEKDMLPPPPPPPRKSNFNEKEKHKPSVPIAREDDEDIFVGDGVDYTVPNKEMSQSPISEDMDESPHNHQDQSHLTEPVYGPIRPSEPAHAWQPQLDGYDAIQAQMAAAGYQGEWAGYQYAEQQLAYPEQYMQQGTMGYDVLADPNIPQDPRLMTQADKDKGLGSVFKRDDDRLKQLREKDAREKDPNFISDSYSECYPGYQGYNQEVARSDDEDDLSKMDMGGRAKGRLHRWDFETEEEWAKYNDQKEAMPKAAFQFGVKMQDGRKTRKQNKDQKLSNDLHKINKILARKKGDKDGGEGHYDDDMPSGKKQRA